MKFARTAKKRRALMITGPKIWSGDKPIGSELPVRDNKRRTKVTRVTPTNHGNATLVNGISINLDTCDEL